ncbi:MAG TPA: DUF2206 domain-containing protein [Candidatus Saccharimonadia bacterium]|nr:DUF2206 domain-containing protein [Candidatus Saccharimonadia bacterium]
MRKILFYKSKAKLFVLACLALANTAYPTHNFLGWIITLVFFLIIPGYLLLNTLRHGIRSRWLIVVLSLALSMLILMVSGLALNSLHTFGLTRPLTTLNIFIVLDLVTIALLLLNKKNHLKLPSLKIRATVEQVIVALGLTALPLLSIGGAIRLNNGGSDVLTMIMFAAIALLFMLLILRKGLQPLYAYAVFTIGLSVLLSISLRGWLIVANDIQHEFEVFQLASNNNYWNISLPKGDPYNACLSITILPTIISKITTIPAEYVYKAVFQVIFALGVVPIYFLIEKLRNAKLGLIGALIFISFPAFVNSMPYLNRQEIAFVFFGLLILITFLKMSPKPKTILTVLCLFGLILSHYSSGYITIGMLSLSWGVFKLLKLIKRQESPWPSATLPLLSMPIIIVALLFTFLWNMQVTGSSSNLTSTITQTLKGLWEGSSSQSNGVNYALLSPSTINPVQVLAKSAGSNASQVFYIPQQELPITHLGRTISRIISVSSLNSAIRSFSAKILQILLLLGTLLLFIRLGKKSSVYEIYYFSLVIACIILLVLITVLPQLSVDFSVNRLFQETLVIIALPIIVAAEFLLGFLKRYRTYISAFFFAFLFLDLSGFVPQALGGYPPQLALNNWGTDYDIYYIHKGEVVGAKWLSANDSGKSATADFYAQGRLNNIKIEGGVTNILNTVMTSTYLYQDYANVHYSLYGAFLGGDVIEYAFPDATLNRNLVYSNQSSRIYLKPE